MMQLMNGQVDEVDVAIIGAGFVGLGMGIRLKMEGTRSFVIFERADELGGTWRDNVYPGCACDVPSLMYWFSFDQNPNWSRKYSSQPEILAYLKQSARRFKVREHIRFKEEVTLLRFDETEGRWLVQTRSGQLLISRAVSGYCYREAGRRIVQRGRRLQKFRSAKPPRGETSEVWASETIHPLNPFPKSVDRPSVPFLPRVFVSSR